MIFNSPFPDVKFPIKDTFSVVFNNGKLKQPSKVALISAEGEKVTYQTLYNQICQFACSLNVLGLKKGDVIAIYSPNDIQYPVVMYGAVRQGVTVTTANPNYLASEFAYQLKDSRAKVIFCHPSVINQTLEACKIARIPANNIYVFGKNDIDTFLCVETLIKSGKSGLLNVKPHDYSEKELLNDPAYLCYSSGTTGRSKGVISTNINLVSNVYQHGVFEDPTDDKIVHIAVLPFYHIYGLQLFMHAAFFRSETLVVMSKFDLVEFLTLVQKYKVTHANIVPPIAIGLAKHPIVDKFDITSLRHVLSGAAPLGTDVSKEFTARIKVPIKQAYGMTETSPLALYTPKREIIDGTCGVLAPNMNAKIISPEGKLLGYNQEGELCLRGPNVMKGYLNNEEATKSTLIDGWLHTGDIAICYPNGYFAIVDRIKELIKYKGLQVVPAELESYLLGHPDIADAAVIPREDETAGEVPKAYVVLKPGSKLTEKEIQDFIQAKVSHHKYLRGGVEFINEIPKSASGKILRRILRDMDKAGLKAKL